MQDGSITSIRNFNPRSREGSDRIFNYFISTFFISIHAPAKGATKNLIKGVLEYFISIHAPAKGATIFSGLHCK